MRRTGWLWLVISSALIASLAAETRPQYGGTARVAIKESLTSLDPGDDAQGDSFARRGITLLLFDTLVNIDQGGRIQPSLAASWTAQGNRHWQFHLRRGVKFHDGTPLSAEIVAASLRTANPAWTISAEGETVTIEVESSGASLLAELARPRNAIAKRSSDLVPSGTGPFRIVDWQAGKKLTLAAAEDYWRGRPYLDGVEIEMGRSYRDQMTALDLGKSDLVEVPAEQIHRASLEGHRLSSSLPVELVALVFSTEATSPDEKSLREALALSIDRGSIRNVLLQGAGQPAGGILPNWMSGYEFVFQTNADLAAARHMREQVRTVPTWKLGYDGSDPVARLMAERIALNAKDAGLSLQPTTSETVELRLVRIMLASGDPWTALEAVAASRSLPPTKGSGRGIEDLYAAEQSALASRRLIPLFHLPETYAAGSALRNWGLSSSGGFDLADAWLGSKQ